MTDILGYDIDGQPLRAGDRVVMVRPIGHVPEGGEMLVIGHPLPNNRRRGRDIRVIFEKETCATNCCRIRKIQPKPNHEQGSWEEIEKLTGWVPEGVTV